MVAAHFRTATIFYYHLRNANNYLSWLQTLFFQVNHYFIKIEFVALNRIKFIVGMGDAANVFYF